MDKDFLEAITMYDARPHTELSAVFLQKSKDGLVALLTIFMTGYINDST